MCSLSAGLSFWLSVWYRGYITDWWNFMKFYLSLCCSSVLILQFLGFRVFHNDSTTIVSFDNCWARVERYINTMTSILVHYGQLYSLERLFSTINICFEKDNCSSLVINCYDCLYFYVTSRFDLDLIFWKTIAIIYQIFFFGLFSSNCTISFR